MDWTGVEGVRRGDGARFGSDNAEANSAVSFRPMFDMDGVRRIGSSVGVVAAAEVVTETGGVDGAA